MPKVKITGIEEKNCLVRACISKNMELLGMDDEKVAIKLHCVKRTFQNKMKRPETFTLGEIRKLSAVLKLSEEDKIMLI